VVSLTYQPLYPREDPLVLLLLGTRVSFEDAKKRKFLIYLNSNSNP
jgi:hypothetical protein